MNRLFVYIFAALVIASTCRGSIGFGLSLPLDDARSSTRSAPTPQLPSKSSQTANPITRLRSSYESSLSPGSRPYSGVPKEVQPLTGPPPGYALPIHRPSGVGFSGLGYRGDMGAYFLPIGDSGGLLVYPCGAGDFISAVVLYLKTDPEFVALRGASDYPARRAWELQRTNALRKQIQDALSK